MRFSIVVPVYNVEKYIRECLDSIHNQNFDDYEVVLIDDGSQDDSGEICDEYAHKYANIKVVHKDNQGLVSARREGYRHAIGEYIINCDSDDFIEPFTLNVLNETIIKYAPDLILYNSTLVYDDSKKTFGEHLFSEGFIEKEWLFDTFLLSAHANSLCMKAYKRDILDIERDYSKYYKLNYGEDLLQSIPLGLNAERIYYLDRQLYNYRIGSGMMSQYNNQQYWSFKEVYSVLKEATKRINLEESDLKSSKFLVQAAYDAIHLNLFADQYHEEDVIQIIRDEEFIKAYGIIRKTKYINLFTLKQRIILALIHFNLIKVLKFLFVFCR